MIVANRFDARQLPVAAIVGPTSEAGATPIIGIKDEWRNLTMANAAPQIDEDRRW